MRIPYRVGAVCLALLGGLAFEAARGQEAAAPVEGQRQGDVPATTQPSTQLTSQAGTQPSSAPVNLLRSPYDTMHFFLRTVQAAEVGAAKYEDAMVCLDFGDMDAEKVRGEGPEYVKQLAAILSRLQKEGYFDPEDKKILPDDPLGDLQSLGKNPIVIVLERIARQEEDEATGGVRTIQEWKFSAATVADIPNWHAGLDDLIERMAGRDLEPAAVEEGVRPIDPEALNAPRRTMTFFLGKVAAVRKASNPEDIAHALSCLDFSEAVAEALRKEMGLEERTPEVEKQVAAELKRRGPAYVEKFRDVEGITYVEDLERIIQAMLDDGTLDLEDLPETPDPERKPIWAVGGRPLMVVLVRGDDGQWRFSPQTVKDVPRMVQELTAAGGVAPAEGPPGVTTPTGPEVTRPEAGALAARRESGPRAARDETRSPRVTLETFRTAMKDRDLATAVGCMDLSQLSEAEGELAYVLAGKLWLVMAREEKVVLQTVPDETGSTEPYRVLTRKAGRIEIGPRVKDDKVEWLFTQRTVRDIERLYETFQSRPIHEDWKDQRLAFWTLPSLYVREYLVPASLKRVFWGLQVWQWLGVLLVVLLGLLVRRLAQLLLPPISRRLLRTAGADMLPAVLRKSLRPMANLAMVAAWWGGLQFLDLGAAIMGWTWLVLRLVMVVVAVHAFYRLTDLVMGYFAGRAARTASKLDDVLVPLLQKTLKVLVVALGLILIAKVLGFQITPLLAGLGVGGLAFGLAAQDTLKNFFGSVNVVLDRPFQVGDWVKVGQVEGTVESVGLRSSRIRTFYNSQMTVPNSEIMNTTVDNMGRRRYRRTSTAISVTYSTTPEQLEAFCEGIREIIRRHPFTRKDYFHVYVSAFAASSIDILLYCFHETPDWGKELRERHRLYLDIIRLANRVGIEFAFPTQTIHLQQEDGTPANAPSVPPGPAVPKDWQEAVQFGRAEAAAIVAETTESKGEQPKSG